MHALDKDRILPDVPQAAFDVMADGNGLRKSQRFPFVFRLQDAIPVVLDINSPPTFHLSRIEHQLDVGVVDALEESGLWLPRRRRRAEHHGGRRRHHYADPAFNGDVGNRVEEETMPAFEAPFDPSLEVSLPRDSLHQIRQMDCRIILSMEF